MGCINAPPKDLALANKLYAEIYDIAFKARDGEGAISWPVVLQLATDFGLSPDQRIRLLRYTGAIETVVQQHRLDEFKKKNPPKK